MLQFDLQYYEALTVAQVRIVKFISRALFWSTGQLVYDCSKINSLVVFVSLITGLYHRDVLLPGANSYTEISLYLFPLYHSTDQTFLRICPGPLSAGKWKEGQDDPGYCKPCSSSRGAG